MEGQENAEKCGGHWLSALSCGTRGILRAMLSRVLN